MLSSEDEVGKPEVISVFLKLVSGFSFFFCVFGVVEAGRVEPEPDAEGSAEEEEASRGEDDVGAKKERREVEGTVGVVAGVDVVGGDDGGGPVVDVANMEAKGEGADAIEGDAGREMGCICGAGGGCVRVGVAVQADAPDDVPAVEDCGHEKEDEGEGEAVSNVGPCGSAGDTKRSPPLSSFSFVSHCCGGPPSWAPLVGGGATDGGKKACANGLSDGGVLPVLAGLSLVGEAGFLKEAKKSGMGVAFSVEGAGMRVEEVGGVTLSVGWVCGVGVLPAATPNGDEDAGCPSALTA